LLAFHDCSDITGRIGFRLFACIAAIFDYKIVLDKSDTIFSRADFDSVNTSSHGSLVTLGFRSRRTRRDTSDAAGDGIIAKGQLIGADRQAVLCIVAASLRVLVTWALVDNARLTARERITDRDFTRGTSRQLILDLSTFRLAFGRALRRSAASRAAGLIEGLGLITLTHAQFQSRGTLGGSAGQATVFLAGRIFAL
jgi:hypothetical protein